ncbi:MAG: hypothetical protein R3Y04_05330, partial [Rikenellaceae bacterium]
MAHFRQIDIKCLVDALLNPNERFNSLKGVEVLVDSDGIPNFYVGNNSIVAKVSYQGSLHALKCYENSSDEFKSALQLINTYVSQQDQNYLFCTKLLLNEFRVFDSTDREHLLSVELYPWIEGVSLTQYVAESVYYGEYSNITSVLDSLIELATWLIEQEFSHGDIKCDNIIVTNDGNLKLVDFNNIYIPSLLKSPTSEVGTQGYRHYMRDVYYYNNHLDDFPLLVIIATLMVAEKSLTFYNSHNNGDFLMFNSDKLHLGSCEVYNNAKAFFRGSIVEREFFALLESPTPQVANLYDWLHNLKMWRERPSTRVEDLFFDQQKEKYGLCDKDGRILLPALCDIINDFNNNLIALSVNNIWGVVDRDLNQIKPFDMEYVSDVKEGA